MAEDSRGQNGQDRATSALVLAEVRGLRDFVDARFTDQQRQLDVLTGLPAAVAALQRDHDALDEREAKSDENMDKRVSKLESDARGDRDWRRSSLPIILLTVAIVALSIITLILHVGG